MLGQLDLHLYDGKFRSSSGSCSPVYLVLHVVLFGARLDDKRDEKNCASRRTQRHQEKFLSIQLNTLQEQGAIAEICASRSF